MHSLDLNGLTITPLRTFSVGVQLYLPKLKKGKRRSLTGPIQVPSITILNPSFAVIAGKKYGKEESMRHYTGFSLFLLLLDVIAVLNLQYGVLLKETTILSSDSSEPDASPLQFVQLTSMLLND